MGVMLPSEYQPVEYLESTGADQWIDVGFPITDTLSMELTFSAVTDTASKYYMGLYSNNQGDFFLYNSNGKFQVAYGCSYTTMHVNVNTDKHTFAFSFDSENVVIRENNNIIEIAQKFAPLKTDRHIRIAGSFISGQNKSRTYAFVAYSGSNKIADFIPCYRKSDDKPGMYDIVTGTFFVNARTGADFLVGADVNESISTWLVARRRMLMRKSDLPTGYKKLDYIQKNGTNAVITIPQEYCQLAVGDILDIKLSCIRGDGYQCFAGRSGLWDFEITNWNADKTIGEFRMWNDVFTKTSPASNECIVGNIYDLEYQANTTNAARGINIGAYNDAGANYAFYGRIYRVTYKSNGQTILDMIPAKRLSDGKIGMYETVQGAFFSSTSGVEFQEP